MNYKAHIAELNLPYPEAPVFFMKPDSSILKGNKVFFIPDWTDNLQYELEVVYRISRLGKHIQKKFAYRYYDAVALGLDLTARDLQEDCRRRGLPWEICKSFDGSAVLSEFVPLEDLPDKNSIVYVVIVERAEIKIINFFIWIIVVKLFECSINESEYLFYRKAERIDRTLESLEQVDTHQTTNTKLTLYNSKLMT